MQCDVANVKELALNFLRIFCVKLYLNELHFKGMRTSGADLGHSRVSRWKGYTHAVTS